MSTGIEQSLVLAFVAAHTPLVSAEIAEKHLKDLTASELTVVVTDKDDATVECIGTILNSGRQWRAREQTWTGSHLHRLIPPDRLYTKTWDEFLNESNTDQVYVDTASNSIYIPHHTPTLTNDDAVSLLSLLTGYDFTDLGTIPDLHTSSFLTKDQITTPPAAVQGRLEGIWSVTGGILNGTAYFISDAYHDFADTDLGTLPTETATAPHVSAENGDAFLTEEGGHILAE